MNWYQTSPIPERMKPFNWLSLTGMWLFLMAHSGFAQTSYSASIAQHREAYKAEFLQSTRSPLKEKDLAKLRFYEPDSTYRVEATVRRIPNEQPFDLPTYDGQKKPYVKYAVLTFQLHGQSQQLAIYRSLQLARLPQYRDYVFVPFKDPTNGGETYGGGRYMDLRTNDINEGKLILDFNKAYNPYCAYSEGYACPIPPAENQLNVTIAAGEKKFHN